MNDWLLRETDGWHWVWCRADTFLYLVFRPTLSVMNGLGRWDWLLAKSVGSQVAHHQLEAGCQSHAKWA
jgi:hypothetical protein